MPPARVSAVPAGSSCSKMWRDRMFRQCLVATVAMLTAMSFARAHVDLEAAEAPLGTAYKAVARVNQGIDGWPTVTIRVRTPDAVIAVRPMPKPGWKLDAIKGKYSKPTSARGANLSEGITELSWSGGKLVDGYYDEFVFQA